MTRSGHGILHDVQAAALHPALLTTAQVRLSSPRLAAASSLVASLGHFLKSFIQLLPHVFTHILVDMVPVTQVYTGVAELL